MTYVGKYRGNFISDWNLNQIQEIPYHNIMNGSISSLECPTFGQSKKALLLSLILYCSFSTIILHLLN